MAATTFTNVKTVTICGTSITEPTSITIEHDGDIQDQAASGATINNILGTGAKTRRVTVEALDPITAFTASKASGDCFFTLTKGCDESGDVTYYIADSDDSSSTVGEGFDFNSNDPGQVGSGSVSALCTGSTFTTTEPT